MAEQLAIQAVGDRVTFGTYPQGANGEVAPIEWRVLHIEDGKALLISEKCLMLSGYCDKKKACGRGSSWYCMWGNSLAREMCNGHFFYEAFSTMEQNRIVPKKIEVREGPKCEDAVFLLSEKEALAYFQGDEDRKAKPTEYVMKQKKEVASQIRHYTNLQGEDYASWWILPDEQRMIVPKQIRVDGVVEFNGRNIYYSDFTIRPCIQITLE